MNIFIEPTEEASDNLKADVEEFGPVFKEIETIDDLRIVQCLTISNVYLALPNNEHIVMEISDELL